MEFLLYSISEQTIAFSRRTMATFIFRTHEDIRKLKCRELPPLLKKFFGEIGCIKPAIRRIIYNHRLHEPSCPPFQSKAAESQGKIGSAVVPIALQKERPLPRKLEELNLESGSRPIPSLP